MRWRAAMLGACGGAMMSIFGYSLTTHPFQVIAGAIVFAAICELLRTAPTQTGEKNADQ